MGDRRDLRASRRLNTSWTAVWWTKDRSRTNHGIVRDVSAGGVFLELPGKAIDTDIGRMNMECLLPTGDVSRVEGRVVWRGRKSGKDGVGVALENIDPAFREFVKRANSEPEADSSSEDITDSWGRETQQIPLERPPKVAERRNYVVVMTGPHAGAYYPVDSSIAIGRHADCDVVLLDPSASRKHTAIRSTQSGLEVEDLSSSNGTFLNGHRVERGALKNGDRIQIGASILKVFSEDDLEVRLRHAQKMESLGRLASGAAHDFNNILSVVTASASLIEEISENPQIREMASSILEASENAARITRQMLGIARRTEFKRQSFDLARLLKGLEAVFQQRARSGIELDLNVEHDLWILGDYGQLEQVILNLFNNAVDSLGDSNGRIALNATSERLNLNRATELGVRAGAYIRLSIGDTGAGMDEKTLKYATEPYFTTKPEGFGTGLGLPMAQGIIEGHEGILHLESEPSEGTEVVVWLPQTQADTSEELETLPHQIRAAKADRLVLLVDGDAPVRRAVAEMLHFLGHRVVEAENGAQALASAAEHVFDLAILELQLPHSSGVELAQALKGQHPNLDIVVCSASAEMLAPEFTDQFIQKPFELTTLASALKRFD